MKGRFLLYVGAGLAFFIFWMLWVFPYDALKARIVTEIENQTRGRYKLDVGQMDVSLFGSVTMKNLSVSERVKGQEQLLLKTPKMKIGFSPFGLLSKKVDFSFYVQGSKGELEGDYRQEDEEFDFRILFDDYPLKDLSYLQNVAKVGMRGTLNGEVNLSLNKTDPGRNNGQIDLEIKNLTLEATKINLDPTSPDSAMEIPEIKLSGSSGSGIKGEVKKEDLVVNSISFKGGDLDLDVDGKVSLVGAKPGEYRLALQGGFKVVESLAKAIPFLQLLEQQKTADGIYPLSVTGRLAKPSIRIGKFPIPL